MSRVIYWYTDITGMSFYLLKQKSKIFHPRLKSSFTTSWWTKTPKRSWRMTAWKQAPPPSTGAKKSGSASGPDYTPSGTGINHGQFLAIFRANVRGRFWERTKSEIDSITCWLLKWVLYLKNLTHLVLGLFNFNFSCPTNPMDVLVSSWVLQRSAC